MLQKKHQQTVGLFICSRIAGEAHKLNPLILPMAAHIALASFLYMLLTIARAPKVWGIGKKPDGTNPWAAVEPRISANLSNQFEWPVFFYAACILLIQNQSDSAVAAGLAWIFILGRVAHSCVQILTTNVRMRGLVFTINFLATLGLWGLVIFAFKE
ncbi:MAPEG family protein [Pseudomonas anguilliseptica]|uniref:MAPEG family protein n=1 Tax=Pseudomonas anguilliseptica TaxID=53406 RepID=UPI0022AEFA07|nr:MAPEG family protein [Pseudomonas anguilliseptica]MCZ4322434.1 MAPEG family protein [Pseudomonas anguilliseptica]